MQIIFFSELRNLLHHRRSMVSVKGFLILPTVDQQYRFRIRHRKKLLIFYIALLPAAEPIPHCLYGRSYSHSGSVRIPVIRHHAPQVLVFLIFIFHGSLQPVLAIQIHHNAALVKPVMAVRKICLHHKAEIFFFGLNLQDRGIVIPKMVVCPLPQICSGLCHDYDFLTANFIIRRFIDPGQLFRLKGEQIADSL